MTARTTCILVAAVTISHAAYADEPSLRDDAASANRTGEEGTDAHRWMSVELPVAMDKLAALPAIGMFLDNGAGAIGLRVRAGALRSNDAATMDQSTLASSGSSSAIEPVAMLGFAMRRRLGGGSWVELGGDLGVTRSGFAPSVEVGAGWNLHVSSLAFAPTIRYVRIDDRQSPLDAFLVGAELRFANHRIAPRAPRIADAVPATHQPAAPSTCTNPATTCDDAFARAIDDGSVAILNDRISIDVAALLDADHQLVHDKGNQLITAIANLWGQHPEWRRLRIEGHAHLRLPSYASSKESQRWAALVQDELLDRGASAERLEVAGLGYDPDHAVAADSAHDNRIDLVIERGEMVR